MRTVPPISRTRRAQASQSMPGPFLGYRNDSIRVLIIADLSLRTRLGQMALRIASRRESPLIRWAAQSAEISLQLIPHTFSV